MDQVARCGQPCCSYADLVIQLLELVFCLIPCSLDLDLVPQYQKLGP